jgi:hypothetical protein
MASFADLRRRRTEAFLVQTMPVGVAAETPAPFSFFVPPQHTEAIDRAGAADGHRKREQRRQIVIGRVTNGLTSPENEPQTGCLVFVWGELFVIN